MATADIASELLTVPQVGARLGVTYFHMRRLIATGAIPPPRRFTGRHVYTVGELARIKQAAQEAGFLEMKTAEPVAPSA